MLKEIKAPWLIHCATHYVKQHNAHDITKIINSNIEFGTILLDLSTTLSSVDVNI